MVHTYTSVPCSFVEDRTAGAGAGAMHACMSQNEKENF